MASELTGVQLALLQWFKFYYWLFGPDGPRPLPDQEIIDNDEDLDNWIENWKNKRGSDSSNSKSFIID